MAEWQPREFVRFERSVCTSMSTSVIMTDAGRAHVKALGGPRGPHPLVCEWVGSHMARWLGLPTFDFALLHLTELDRFPLCNESGEIVGEAEPGPAFAARTVAGATTWGGDNESLKKVENEDDLSRLVVLDTWLLNCDRYRPAEPARAGVSDLTPLRPRARRNCDNVFFTAEGASTGKLRLIAMDFTEILTCGGDLTPQLASINRVQEERVYGLFPEFKPQMIPDVVRDTADKLRTIQPRDVESATASIPDKWEVDERTRQAIVDMVVRRAPFVADRVYDWIGGEIGTEKWKRTLFDETAERGDQ